MNKYEIGQGLVNYGLMLLLVLLAVLELLNLVTPEIRELACAYGVTNYCQ